MEKPVKLDRKDISLESLEVECQEYIDYVFSDGYHEDNDFSHYIFETAIETFFGKNVWKKINEAN